MNIADRTFLITGGASGLGRATALMILKQGGRVVALDVNETVGSSLQQEFGPDLKFFKTDVIDEDQVRRSIHHGIEALGPLSGVVNCAGIGPAARVVGRQGPHVLELFQKVIAVNLTGTFNVIRLAAEQMQHNDPNAEGERGVVINTASVAAFDGQIGQAAYSASKGGIVAMTLPMAREFARMGIRVVTIAPGIFETPMMAGFSDEVRASLGRQVPFPSRLGRPEEYAALVRQIIENPMLNGEVIRLDGAIRMAPR